MNISAVSNISPNYYNQLSSGKKINSAADDASGLAIAEKTKTQVNGYDVGASNAADSKSMLNISDGALSSVTDSLERIYELSIKASSSLYGKDERASIQTEIDQLKQSISDIASNTSFNEKKLLDGSSQTSHVASKPDGSGMDISMHDTTLESLGIADFDVTGDFDVSQITDALKKVNSARSQIGAQTNALDHTIHFNQNASQNLTASQSRLEDLDYGKAVSDKKTEELLSEYRLYMQKEVNANDGMVLKLLNA
ncbi:flagellin [Lachnospiraceae bacterium OttesenSCG-928-D06]|nr:flagellin [Lachnospiraceae bacterium OttesenSCG-928-D06]